MVTTDHLVVDGGTTNTRVYAVAGGRVLASESVPVGARDTAIDGSNARLRDALSAAIIRTIEQAATQARSAARGAGAAGFAPSRCLCVGMIGSPMGLHTVPHVLAPAGREELAAATEWVPATDVLDVGRGPAAAMRMGFVPGLKAIAQGPREMTLADIGECDIMRGEETQVLGLSALEAARGPFAVLIAGSHTKLIAVDAANRISGGITTLAGELMSAVMSGTILAGSLAASAVGGAAVGAGGTGGAITPHNALPDPAMVRTGADLARRAGITRALFGVRLMDQLLQEPPSRCFDFLTGIVAGADCQALCPWVRERSVSRVYLVGPRARTEAYELLMADELGASVALVNMREGYMEQAVVAGAGQMLGSGEVTAC